MSEKIVVPALGESVTEATVSRWLKSVGEKVKFVGRNAAASPATGNLNKHLAEQKEILEKVVGRFN